jgi:hypothetical protein
MATGAPDVYLAFTSLMVLLATIEGVPGSGGSVCVFWQLVKMVSPKEKTSRVLIVKIAFMRFYVLTFFE